MNDSINRDVSCSFNMNKIPIYCPDGQMKQCCTEGLSKGTHFENKEKKQNDQTEQEEKKIKEQKENNKKPEYIKYACIDDIENSNVLVDDETTEMTETEEENNDDKDNRRNKNNSANFNVYTYIPTKKAIKQNKNLFKNMLTNINKDKLKTIIKVSLGSSILLIFLLLAWFVIYNYVVNRS